MESQSQLAAALLQLGLLMGVVLIGNAVASRHLPVDCVPGVLQSRIELGNRLRPWLGAATLAILAAGLFLRLG